MKTEGQVSNMPDTAVEHMKYCFFPEQMGTDTQQLAPGDHECWYDRGRPDCAVPLSRLLADQVGCRPKRAAKVAVLQTKHIYCYDKET